jgi:hypothetical protein
VGRGSEKEGSRAGEEGGRGVTSLEKNSYLIQPLCFCDTRISHCVVVNLLKS